MTWRPKRLALPVTRARGAVVGVGVGFDEGADKVLELGFMVAFADKVAELDRISNNRCMPGLWRRVPKDNQALVFCHHPSRWVSKGLLVELDRSYAPRF